MCKPDVCRVRGDEEQQERDADELGRGRVDVFLDQWQVDQSSVRVSRKYYCVYPSVPHLYLVVYGIESDPLSRPGRR